MSDLLSVAQARERVLGAIRPLEAEPVPVAAALSRVLAREVRAVGDVPPFANSAMDGFAVHAGAAGRRLVIVDEARAGHPAQRRLGEAEAIRISTGAAIPAEAEAVIRIEDTTENDGIVELHAEVAPEHNLREAGEDLVAGALVLSAGSPLGPIELAAAVAAGAGELWCARRPRVVVLGTGDELREPGEALGPGEIHNSNAVGLAALAEEAGAEILRVGRVADTRAATEAALREALELADLLVLSGGVSVGPHDHVKPALEAVGVPERFWGVALKPGKPTWFGAQEDGPLVFGLPGNPVSALVTFGLFARPALRALQGADPLRDSLSATLAEPVGREARREQAVRVRLERRRGGLLATPTGPQGSHILSSLLGAGGLAMIPAGDGELPAGAEVEVLPL